MRKIVALIAGLAVLAFVNVGIYQREQLLTHGKTVLLRLRPVDPRSLMQGDYMRLNFEIADQAFPFEKSNPPADGQVIVALDPHGIAEFRRLGDGRPLAPDETALRYRIRGGDPKFATNAFFFEEGRADAYNSAKYGEFRVGADGGMILTGLRDDRLRPLGSKR
jgi:uncharacterized membrane-anchored protein